jgi:predicted AAA+ superfamily ATPase
MVRNNLTNEIEVRELVSYLAGNYARLSTNSELAEIIGVKNPSTVKKYIGFLSDSYLIFQAYKYDYSVSKQILNPKKSYFIDNGLVKRVGFSFSDNLGHLLENLVYIELLRRGKEVFYYSKKQECDFLLVENNIVTVAIQVCYTFYSERTRKREVDGLLEAMETFNLTTGLIITSDMEDKITVDDKRIDIIPAWKWLLE